MSEVSAPTGSNNAAKWGNTITGAILNAALTVGLNALYAEVPFLALPVIRQVFEYLVRNILAQKLYEQLALMVTFTIIDIQISGELTDFKKSLNNLKAAQAAGEPDAIQKALLQFQVAAQNLAHCDGSASPGHL